MNRIRGRLLPSTIRIEDRNEIGFWASDIDQELLMHHVPRVVYSDGNSSWYNGYVTEASMELHTDEGPVYILGTLIFAHNVPYTRFLSADRRVTEKLLLLYTRLRRSVGMF